MKLKNLYFAMRHGESKANVAGIIISSIESGVLESFTLTTVGENQVDDSVEKAKKDGMLDKDIIIYSSPFSRCKKTAEIAKQVLGVRDPIQYDERLRERNFGDFEKTHNSNYEKVWVKDLHNSDQKDHGVESATEVQVRVLALINDLESRYAGKKILLVSHGDALQILQTGFQGISAARHRSMPHLNTAEIRQLNAQKPANSKLVNVCIIPNQEVGKECVKISQAIAAQLPGTLFALDGETKFPHMTTFMFRVPDSAVEQVVESVGRLVAATKPLNCEATGFYATPGRYYEVSYKLSPEFRAFQHNMTDILKDYRNNPGKPHFEGYYNPGNERQWRNVLATGYDLLAEDSRPHITLTRFAEGQMPTTFPEFDHGALSFPVSTVAVYLADDNGAVYQELKRFSISA